MDKTATTTTTAITKNTGKLAVLSQIAYECLNTADKLSTSAERIKAALRIAILDFPNEQMSQLEYFDSNEDMYAVVDRSTEEAFVAYRGTTPGLKWGSVCDYANDLMILCALKPYRVTAAIHFAHKVKESFPTYSITTTGHSLGGRIAEQVADACRCKCESFNPGYAPFSKLKKKHPNENIISHKVKGDIICRGKGLGEERKISVLVECTGMKCLAAHAMQNFLEEIRLKYAEMKIQAEDQAVYLPQGQMAILSDKIYECISGMCIENGTAYFLTSAKSSAYTVDKYMLAEALSLCYDESIQASSVAFAISPIDPLKLDARSVQRIFWPDKLLHKGVISGTAIGDVLARAGTLLQQMTTGVIVDDLTGKQDDFFYFPEEFKPMYFFDNSPRAKEKVNYYRVCIEVDQVVVSDTQDAFSVVDVKMRVRARKLTVNTDKNLLEIDIKDPNDCCYKFAQNLTKLYDVVSKYYPALEQLKQVVTALCIAQWCLSKKIPISLPSVQALLHFKLYPDYTSNLKSLLNDYHKVFSSVDLRVKIDESGSPMAKKVWNLPAPYKGNKVMNPLLQIPECAECGAPVELAASGTKAGDSKFHCLRHHPMKCVMCEKLTTEKDSVVVDSARYHKRCVKCCICFKVIEGEVDIFNDMIVHKECGKAAEEMLSNETSKSGCNNGKKVPWYVLSDMACDEDDKVTQFVKEKRIGKEVEANLRKMCKAVPGSVPALYEILVSAGNDLQKAVKRISPYISKQIIIFQNQ